MKNEIPKGNEVTGNMANHLDSRFLNSTVLAGALAESGKSSLPVTIDRMEHHELLKYENGQTAKDVILMYFKGSSKPLKLCSTNLKRLISLFGPMGDQWKGQQVNLQIEQTRRPDLGGKQGPCVRIQGVRL